MSAPVPRLGSWHPDPATGGTKYWDGSRWTGDTRPRRRPFAAAAAYRRRGIVAVILGGLFVLTSPSVFSNGQSDDPVATFFTTILLGIATAATGVYLLRGQGPRTDAVEARLVAEREARRGAEYEAALLRRIAPPTSHDAAAAAQINALANPDTPKNLQAYQNLLYTGAITEDEYQAAKDKVFRGQ